MNPDFSSKRVTSFQKGAQIGDGGCSPLDLRRRFGDERRPLRLFSGLCCHLTDCILAFN